MEAPAASLGGGVRGAVAVVTAAQSGSAGASLARLARVAEAAGAVALLAVPPGRFADLDTAARSSWAQPMSRAELPGIPTFLAGVGVADGVRVRVP